jgi:YrbI family 3-deoxy-D-manno-octulosonate 8-phosphate phosphatase
MKIKTIICDLDGCLTNGHQHLNDEGEKLFKTFHARDKTAIRKALACGIRVIIVSADDWNGAKEWVASFNDPGIEFIHRKIKVFDECADVIDWDSTAGIGDDFIDLPFLEKCRLRYCPKDALSTLALDPFIFQLPCNGGSGVFAEALIDIERQVKK